MAQRRCTSLDEAYRGDGIVQCSPKSHHRGQLGLLTSREPPRSRSTTPSDEVQYRPAAPDPTPADHALS
eukprot:1354612-Amphidinium_carterae.1